MLEVDQKQGLADGGVAQLDAVGKGIGTIRDAPRDTPAAQLRFRQAE
jgi:hypothetical protein